MNYNNNDDDTNKKRVRETFVDTKEPVAKKGRFDHHVASCSGVEGTTTGTTTSSTTEKEAPEQNGAIQIKKALDSAAFFETIIDTIFPDTWGESMKKAKTFMNARKVFHINGKVHIKGKAGKDYLGSPLAEMIQRVINNATSKTSNDSGNNNNNNDILEMIISNKSMVQTEGCAGEGGQSNKEAKEYKEELVSGLTAIVQAFIAAASEEEGGKLRKEQDHAAARVFVVYLMCLFESGVSTVESRKNALKSLICGGRSSSSGRKEEEDDEGGSLAAAAEAALKDFPSMARIIAGALFEGDNAIIKLVSHQAAKQYDFMTNELPTKEFRALRFIQKGFDPTAADDSNSLKVPPQVLMNIFYRGISLEEAQQQATSSSSAQVGGGAVLPFRYLYSETHMHE